MGNIYSNRIRVVFVLAVCICFIISTGPQMQFYAVSLISSDWQSLYGSVYKQAIIKFPSLGEWLANVYQLHNLVMAVFVAWVVASNSNPRSVAWNALWATAFALSGVDVWYGFIQGQITLKWIVENAFSNIFGGVVVAAILISILMAADKIKIFHPGKPWIREFSSSLVVVGGGFAFCSFMYYVSVVFFALIPSQLDMIVSAPVDGFFVTKEDGVLDDSSGPFSLFPENKIHASLLYMSPIGALNIKSDFEKDQAPIMEVFPVSGCRSPDQLRKLGISDDLIYVEPSVSRFEIVGDRGMTDFSVVLSESEKVGIKLSSAKYSIFNLNKDSDKNTFDITQFADDSAVLDVKGNSVLRFYFGLPLLSGGGKSVSLGSRLISLHVNGVLRVIKFTPPESVNSVESRNECGYIPGFKQLLSDRNALELNVKHVDVGILVVLRLPANTKVMSTSDLRVRLSNLEGWVNLKDISFNDFSRAHLGSLEVIQVRGNVTDLSLDEVSKSPKQIETYTAVGDFKATRGQGGVRVFGKAKQVWKDKARQNPTRWEILGWEPKLFIVGVFISIIGFFYTVISRCLVNNKKIYFIG